MSRATLILVSVAFLAAAALAFAVPGFAVFRLMQATIWSIAVLGMVMLCGVSGQFSFAHAAFYGLGAYTAAILANHTSLSGYLSLLVAAFVCYVAGRAFGRVTASQGIWNQALISYALVIAFPQLLRWRPIEKLTGGTQGLYLDPPEAPDWIGMSTDRWWYLICLALLAGGLALARNLIDSRSGRALQAVRDNELAAHAQGIDVARYRATAYGISAAYAGLAGCLAALMYNYVGPTSYGFGLSLQLLIGLVVGGMGSIGGAVIGGVFLQFFPDIAAVIGKRMSAILYAGTLIAVIVAMPNGVAGVIQSVWARLRTLRRDR